MGSTGKATEIDYKKMEAVRRESGLTQAQLGKKLGWKDGSRISRIESGAITPNPEVWSQICKILSISPKEAPAQEKAVRKHAAPVMSTGSWKHDPARKILSYKTTGGITFTVPTDEVNNPETFADWIEYISRQDWATDAEIGGFVKAAMSLRK